MQRSCTTWHEILEDRVLFTSSGIVSDEIYTFMRNTRFIFVEGMMGSGKSTTAWFLTEHLQQNEIPASFLAEGPTMEEPEHPLRVATAFPHPNGIWLDLTVEEFMETSIQKWHNFVQAALRSGVVLLQYQREGLEEPFGSH
jgi:hypothetical protein